MHMTGTLSPPSIKGEVVAGGHKYKYSADLEVKVDVVYIPKPGDPVKEPVRVKVPKEKPAIDKRD